jgi:hypothetical protein
MGLDMYLHKQTYIGNAYREPKDRVSVIGAKGVKNNRITYITEEVAYWRKVNAIHRWFVENVQNNVDECQRSFVSREQLQELLATVKVVLKDHEQATELLPTQPGFFFGSTEYDKDYFDSLEETKKMLTAVLKENHDADFYYQSSW